MKFNVICADPPWKFGDALPGKSRGASRNYPCMTPEEIVGFRPLGDGVHVHDLMEENSVLFLWRVASMQEEALQVVRGWGFKLKTEVVWRKQTVNGNRHFGMGRIVRAEHETCLVATRGRPQVKVKNIRSTFDAPIGRHSAKPNVFYTDIVERLYDGPYLELFAREKRANWECLGNEITP